MTTAFIRLSEAHDEKAFVEEDVRLCFENNYIIIPSEYLYGDFIITVFAFRSE